MSNPVFVINGKKYTNKHGVADIFVRALCDDDYTRGDSKYSASDLIAPVRQVLLSRKHEGEIVTDVVELFARWRGSAIHHELEKYATASSIAEERLYAEVLGVKISAKPDHYDGDTLILDDYKTTSVWSFAMEKKGYKPEWEQQLNILAWLFHQYGFGVKDLRIHAVLWDWNRNEARRNPDYIQKPLHSVPVPLWPSKRQAEFIAERVARLEEWSCKFEASGKLPECTADERWARKTTYAVKKAGVKKAKKVCDTRAMAEQYIKDACDPKSKWEIEERPGASVRCEGYCDAAPWCDQYRRDIV